jgi:hypothetical protein
MVWVRERTIPTKRKPNVQHKPIKKLQIWYLYIKEPDISQWKVNTQPEIYVIPHTQKNEYPWILTTPGNLKTILSESFVYKKIVST